MAGRRPRPPTPEQEARLREMHAGRGTDGGRASNTALAAALGVSDTTVGVWLKDLGLTPNRAPWGAAGRAFWTDDKMAEARRIAAEGGITSAGAAALGCTQKAFREKADAEGWPRRELNDERRAGRLERAARAKALSAAGWKTGAIAAELGVSLSLAAEYLRLPLPEPVVADATPAAAAHGARPSPAKDAPGPRPREGAPSPRRAPVAEAGGETTPRPGWPRRKECPICRVPRMCADPGDRYHVGCRATAARRDNGTEYPLAGARLGR